MKIAIGGIFLSIMLSFSAQQVPHYSQWYLNLQGLNPAFAGLKSCLEIKANYRNQWTGFPSSPKAGMLTFALPIYTKKKSMLTPRQGIGFKCETDKFGSFSMNRLLVQYAGHFNFTVDNRLSVGIGAGVRQFSSDFSTMTTLNPDPIFYQNETFYSPDAQLGFWWNGKNYFLSLSFNELIKSAWRINASSSYHRIHPSFAGGFRTKINNQFTLLPYYVFRIPPKGPLTMDLNLVLSYNNKIDFGVGFRNTDAFIGMLHFKLSERFSFAYSIDLVNSSIAKFNRFSHELGLNFGTCKSANTNKTICPLF